jgi:hypothetical protein
LGEAVSELLRACNCGATASDRTDLEKNELQQMYQIHASRLRDCDVDVADAFSSAIVCLVAKHLEEVVCAYIWLIQS